MTFLVDGTNGGTFPSWTTATRPASPAVGQMGYNTTTGQFDAYTSTGWTSLINSGSSGTILQIVNANTTVAAITSSSTPTDTGLTATITPKFATSKILVTVHLGTVGKYNSDTRVNCYLIRNSTQLSLFTSNSGFNQSTSYNYVASASTEYLDSPATTSAVTYKVQFSSVLNTAAVIVQSDSSMSTITLTEIAA